VGRAVSTAGRDAQIAAVLAEMTALGMWEWRLHSFDGMNLTLAGGQDMTYGHFAQARFRNVSFVSCPVQMKHPSFRLATEHEARTSGAVDALEPGSTVIAIESATANTFEHLSVIVAEAVELTEGVFRY
jgi:hypothetical protein